MPTEAQRRANAKQDATRCRVALWLDPYDAKQLDRLMRKLRLTSRIATVRFLIKHLFKAEHGSAERDD